MTTRIRAVLRAVTLTLAVVTLAIPGFADCSSLAVNNAPLHSGTLGFVNLPQWGTSNGDNLIGTVYYLNDGTISTAGENWNEYCSTCTTSQNGWLVYADVGGFKYLVYGANCASSPVCFSSVTPAPLAIVDFACDAGFSKTTWDTNDHFVVGLSYDSQYNSSAHTASYSAVVTQWHDASSSFTLFRELAADVDFATAPLIPTPTITAAERVGTTWELTLTITEANQRWAQWPAVGPNPIYGYRVWYYLDSGGGAPSDSRVASGVWTEATSDSVVPTSGDGATIVTSGSPPVVVIDGLWTDPDVDYSAQSLYVAVSVVFALDDGVASASAFQTGHVGAQSSPLAGPQGTIVFVDDFETGNTSLWSSVAP